MQGRLIRSKNLSSAMGLATDEALAQSVATCKVPPTLHLYNYIPSVMLGRYQNAASSLRLDRCEAIGIEVNRRATGGGTVFMTPDQLALGLFLPDQFPGLPKSIQGAFEFLSAGLASALEEFGLHAEFQGKNDLTVNGKKIAGLAISQDLEGVTFFHTSLLLDFDLSTMLEILNLPTQKMLDRGISCFGQRMTTILLEVDPHLRKNIDLEKVQTAVHQALQDRLSIPLLPNDLSSEENQKVKELLDEKYENDEWIYGFRSPKRRMAFAERKTEGGLIQVHLSFSGGVIEMIMITGDYFSRTRDIAKLESMLKYCRSDRKGLENRFQEAQAENYIHKVDLAAIIDLIQEAIAFSQLSS